MLYDFECTNCHHQFEAQVKLQDLEESDGCVDCPQCHHPAIRKITNPRHYKHISWASWRLQAGG